MSVTTTITKTRLSIKRTMYQRKVDVDMLDAINSMLTDVSSVSASSEQRVWAKANSLENNQLDINRWLVQQKYSLSIPWHFDWDPVHVPLGWHVRELEPNIWYPLLQENWHVWPGREEQGRMNPWEGATSLGHLTAMKRETCAELGHFCNCHALKHFDAHTYRLDYKLMDNPIKK